MSEQKDYSKTVNLPKTDFKMKASLPQMEPSFVKEWEKTKLYEKLCIKNKDKEKFTFHDGPPYANAHIHIGTALNKILKDFIVKYKSMTGNYVPFTPGWDCHGLPIEQLALKELKIDKNKINKLVFRKQAADFAKKFVEIQKEEFQRLGILADWNNPYLTLDKKYEASIIKVFRDLVKEGFIYRSKKPVHWCLTCETAMADAEVEYDSYVSDSIFVKFKIISVPSIISTKNSLLKDFSVLIWTTTPWTLPSNVALAFSENVKYVAVIFKMKDSKEENLIVAKELLEKIKGVIKAVEYKVVMEFEGIDFVNIRCQNPLLKHKESQGVVAGFVSMDEGTGIVHIAPGHGPEDYHVGLEYGLDILSPINGKGLYTKEVPELENTHIFKANPIIIEKLQKEGKLLAKFKTDHSYPHCWRCKKPIIFRATPQWFLSVDHNGLRKKMLGLIEDINWIPRYSEKRMRGTLSSRPDWCLSRQRLWGVPIPVFYCKECGEVLVNYEIIDKIAKLFEQKGSDSWFEMSETDLLKGLDIKCANCNSSAFKKEEDILDVWFDSGVSHEAVLSSGNYSDLEFPADLYLEGSDQHRGWFQTSLILSVALKGAPPYKSVLTNGFAVDGQGKKMSKSIGNVISSEQLINKYGADIVRLWVAASDYKEDIRISDEIIRGLSDTYRKIRNTLRFLLGNLNGFNVEDSLKFEEMQEIDTYALSELQYLISTVSSSYESYEFHKAASAVNNFCTVFLSGFYLDALKDNLYCDKKDCTTRRSAQSAMFIICSVIIRLTAPILSFTCEEAFQELKKIDASLPESVFLTNIPVENSKFILKADILEKWDRIFHIRKETLVVYEKLRQDKVIGSNLEASLEISYGKKYIDCFEDKNLVSLVLGSWDISYKESDTEDELKIKAKKSEYEKCERCWRYIKDVSNGLCLRCADLI